MGRHVLHTILLILLGAMLLSSRDCHADDTLTDLQKHVEGLRAQQQGGGNADKRVFDKARAEAEAISQSIPQAKKPTSPVATQIPRTHVRAKDGVPFPKREEVVFPTPIPLPTFAMTNTMVEDIPPPVYKKPPRCDRPETRRVESIFDDGNEEETIIGEVLYLPEDLMPLDPGEVFGAKVQTYPYGPNSGDGVNIRMTLDRAPCVPYRLRVTNRARYYDTGDFALKNYDKQPGGRGQYHPWMQERLFLKK